MKTTLLLFDVDGTLMLSGGAATRAMNLTAQELYGKQFNWDGVVVGGNLDPLIFAQAAAINGLDGNGAEERRFREHYLRLLPRELERNKDKIRIMPGITQAIDTLRVRQDVTLGLLTGNYTAAVPFKLRAINMDPAWFTITAFGDEAEDRPALAALAMQRYQRATGDAAQPQRVVVIGDTPRDVQCAHANGCVAFAVATGEFTRQQLADAGADYAVEDLSDPTPLYALID